MRMCSPKLSQFKVPALSLVTLLISTVAYANEGPAWLYFFGYSIALLLEIIPYMGLGAGILCLIFFAFKKHRWILVSGCFFLLIGAGGLLLKKAEVLKGDRAAQQEQLRNKEKPDVAALNLIANQDLARMKAQLEAMQNGLPPQTSADRTHLPDIDGDCLQWQEGLKVKEIVAAARVRHSDYAKLSQETLHARGLDHFRRKEFSDAVVAWEWEVKKNPKSLDGWNDIGMAYQNLSNPELALEYSLKSIALNPSFGHGHYTAGQSYLIMGRYSAARRELQSAVRDGWEEPVSQMVLGLALRGLKDDKAAETAFRRSLSLRPNHSETQRYLEGEPYIPNWPVCRMQIATWELGLKDVLAGKAGSPKKADNTDQADNKQLQQLKKKVPKHLAGQSVKTMHSAALEIFRKRSDVEAAAIWLVAFDGAQEPKEKARYLSWASRALTRAGDVKNGAALAAQADKVAMTDAEVAYGSALVAYQSGRYHDALTRIERAEHDGLTSDPFLFLHGMILQILGRPSDARQTFHRMKKDPSTSGQFIGRVEKPDIWGAP